MEKQNLTKDDEMNDLISIAILIATLFGGTVAADKIYDSVRRAALEKSAKGLPELGSFSKQLTKKNGKSCSGDNFSNFYRPISRH